MWLPLTLLKIGSVVVYYASVKPDVIVDDAVVVSTSRNGVGHGVVVERVVADHGGVVVVGRVAYGEEVGRPVDRVDLGEA